MRNKYCDNSQMYVFPTNLYTALEKPLRKGGIVSSALSVDPFRYNMLVFPINTGDHWFLMICYPNSSMLVCLDSLLVTNLSAFTRIISFIKATFTSHAYEFELKDWLFLAPVDIPSQQDSCSCGVFMCINAFIMATDDEDINYSYDDITHIRKWITNVLVEESPIYEEKASKQYNHNEVNTFEQVRGKSIEILRTIPTNADSIDKSTFKKIKLLAQSRLVKDRRGTHVEHDEIQSDISTFNNAEQSRSQQSSNVNLESSYKDRKKMF